MKQFESIVGNVFAGILLLIVVASVCLTLFNFVFRDGRGMSSYGSRGEFYMAE